MKVFGLVEVDALLYRVTTEVPRGAAKGLRKTGEDMAALARRMAPVDHGFLEDAIKVDPPKGTPQPRDDRGRFMQKQIIVYVDGTMPAYGNKTVGDYAYTIHEHQAPVGNLYALGKRSFEKQLADPGVIVGGGFMDRAAEVVMTGIDPWIEDLLKEVGL